MMLTSCGIFQPSTTIILNFSKCLQNTEWNGRACAKEDWSNNVMRSQQFTTVSQEENETIVATKCRVHSSVMSLWSTCWRSSWVTMLYVLFPERATTREHDITKYSLPIFNDVMWRSFSRAKAQAREKPLGKFSDNKTIIFLIIIIITGEMRATTFLRQRISITIAIQRSRRGNAASVL